ncbi:MAG: hypothetical protein ABI673_03030 [Novosphingobium sp.]
MAMILTFLLGVANFAMHKGVLESGHPLLGHLPRLMRAPGGWASLFIEFLLLLGTMLLVGNGAPGWAAAYAFYSAVNALSAWLILTGRV